MPKIMIYVGSAGKQTVDSNSLFLSLFLSYFYILDVSTCFANIFKKQYINFIDFCKPHIFNIDIILKKDSMSSQSSTS